MVVFSPGDAGHGQILPQICDLIRYHVEKGLTAIEAIYKITPKQILKGILGVPPYTLALPEKLRGIYEDGKWDSLLDRSDLFQQPFDRLW